MSFVKLLLPIACCLFVAVPGTSQEKLPVSWEADSALRAVYFVDIDSGWAVGERGTILKTEDGGRHWQSVSTPRDVIWTDVRFINEKVGWIVGGYYSGALDRSVGLMIRTIDGGKSWQNFSRTGVPFIHKVKFSDEQFGWIQCDSNSLYPAGLLVTVDGGNTWTSPAGATTRKLKIACQMGKGQFAGVDTNNNLAFFDRAGVISKKAIKAKVPTSLFSPAKGQCFCVADGKLFQFSTSDSPDQTVKDSAQNDEVSHLLHINKVYSRDNHLWAVGSPGTIVMHSKDYGRTWTHFRTGETAPLNAVFFLNEDRGWAVGALGKILNTKDGGRTWSIQRNGNLQTGVLNVASSSRKLSPNSLSLLAGSFSHRCGVYLMDPPEQSLADRLRVCQAFNRVGNSGYECQGKASQGTLFQLVKAFRTWNPSVVIVDENDHLTKKWIADAVEAAADPTQFPRLVEFGLKPWKIQKVIEVSESESLNASVSINQYSAHLGRTVGLQSRFACQLLGSSQWRNQNLSWQSLLSTSNSQNSAQGMTVGTAAYSNPNCRRDAKQVQVDNLQQFRSIANWNRSLEQLGRHFVLSPIDEKSWLDQVTAATSGMDNLTVAFFLEDLAATYTRIRKPIMADHTERLILQKSIQSEVGERTLWKMIQRYGSSETNLELNRLLRNRMAKVNANEHRIKPATANMPFDPVRPASPQVEQAAYNEVNVTPASIRNANQLIEIFQNQYPDFETRPEYEMAIAWAKYNSGNRSSLDRLLDTFNSRNLPPTIRRRLVREEQLEQADKRVRGALEFRPAHNEKIILDGRLNDPVWRRSRTQGNSGLAYAMDQDHLYVAGSFELDSPVEVNPKRKRTRDESLLGFERIKVFIDFDRDYSSGIELTIDTRGACNDALWRDATTLDYSYDPKWYVASNVSGQSWNIEFAIPLSELPASNQSPLSGWIISSLRVGGKEMSPVTLAPFLTEEKLIQLPLLHRDATPEPITPTISR